MLELSYPFVFMLMVENRAKVITCIYDTIILIESSFVLLRAYLPVFTNWCKSLRV